MAASRPGFLKVKLIFDTWAPKHLRSCTLQTEFKIAPPYREAVYVLLEAEDVTVALSKYRDLFEALQAEGIVAQGGVSSPKLRGVEFLEEDESILAYYLED